MGEVPHAMTLVDNIYDVEKLNFSADDQLVVLTQTTLSVDDTRAIIEALQAKFPQIMVPGKEDICYATTNRQAAVKDLAPRCDLILVIGAQNSSNSQRLREVAEAYGTRSYLIDDERSLRDEWFDGVQTVGISAGASAPEVLVDRVVDNLKQRGAHTVETLTTITEDVFFPLPKTLKDLPVLAN
jgi:4-hydroxy-3-methylbut-2-enyl diphosphate reductase